MENPAVNRKKKFDHVLSGYAQGSDISKTLEEKLRENLCFIAIEGI